MVTDCLINLNSEAYLTIRLMLRCVNQICFSQIQSKELDEKVDIITAIVNGQQLAVEVITNICCPTEGQSYYISLDDSWPNSTCKKQ